MRRAARIDSTATALIAAAKQLGARYMPLNGIVDGLLLVGGRVLIVDWKSPGGTLTDDQAKLTAAGWPIYYLSTVDQVQVLLREKR